MAAASFQFDPALNLRAASRDNGAGERCRQDGPTRNVVKTAR